MLHIRFSENTLPQVLIAFPFIRQKKLVLSDAFQFIMTINHTKKHFGKTLIFILILMKVKLFQFKIYFF